MVLGMGRHFDAFLLSGLLSSMRDQGEVYNIEDATDFKKKISLKKGGIVQSQPICYTQFTDYAYWAQDAAGVSEASRLRVGGPIANPAKAPRNIAAD